MKNELELLVIDRDRIRSEKILNFSLRCGYSTKLYNNFIDIINYLYLEDKSKLLRIIFAYDDTSPFSAADLIGKFSKEGYSIPVIAMAEAPDLKNVVNTIKAGAIDYIYPPGSSINLQETIVRNQRAARTHSARRSEALEARKALKNLTSRELEVLKLLSKGFTNKLIAQDLLISPRTVEVHRMRMMKKIGESNSAGAIKLYLNSLEF
jgi:FixJ family two-component response regulator